MDEKRVNEVRTALLDAHKALIEDTKRQFVLFGNPEPQPVEFWHLLMHEPAFQWLRRISETIAAIDEALEKEAMTHAEALALAKEELLDEAGPEFSDKLRQACARDLKCLVAWERVTSLLMMEA